MTCVLCACRYDTSWSNAGEHVVFGVNAFTGSNTTAQKGVWYRAHAAQYDADKGELQVLWGGEKQCVSLLVGWLAGSLVGWLVGWWARWLVGWLVGGLVGGLIGGSPS